MNFRTEEILDSTLGGERLSSADAVTLLSEGRLLELGAAANEVRNRANDPDVATYIVDRNINYTNVCVYRCKFCAFYRPDSKHPEAYVLSFDEIGRKIVSGDNVHPDDTIAEAHAVAKQSLGDDRGRGRASRVFA